MNCLLGKLGIESLDISIGVSIVMKQQDCKELQEERVQFTSASASTSISLSSIKGSEGRNSRQEAGLRNLGKDEGGTLLGDLLFMDCSAFFPIAPKTTIPKLEQPRMDQAIPQKLAN